MKVVIFVRKRSLSVEDHLAAWEFNTLLVPFSKGSENQNLDENKFLFCYKTNFPARKILLFNYFLKIMISTVETYRSLKMPMNVF